MITDLKEERKQRFMVVRDKIGRSVFIPISCGLLDCCGIARMAVRRWSKR